MFYGALFSLTCTVTSQQIITWAGVAPWSQCCGNAQHTALSVYPAQSLGSIRWSAPVDLNPQYSGNDLLIHYGSPLISRAGTIITSIKTGATDNFEFRAYGPDGSVRWTETTDYMLPSHNWTPSCGGAIVFGNTYVAMPGAGGTILLRYSPDAVSARVDRNAFYGTDVYNGNVSDYNSKAKICSPLATAPGGNVYFGFRTSGTTGAGLHSGIARCLPWVSGGTWVSASTAAGDSGIKVPVMNCAPAITRNGRYVYAAVSSGSGGYGYLLKLDAKTLATIAKVRLKDPDGNDASLSDAGTASPMIGPDGDVYFGVLENPSRYNHSRGWMLHFDSTLTVQKPTGAFGWDDTASVVPAWCVPSYLGTSSYLILTKYNNYAGAGGDGVNKVAVLDPNDTQVDLVTGTTVMKEVLTVKGVTPDAQFTGTHPDAVREWCINSVAIDPFNRCAMVNSEDGTCYRWNFVTNTLDQALALTTGIGEAYTPTVIGADGAVYAISNATVYSLVSP